MYKITNLTKDYIKPLLPERPKDGNKGTFGSVLNIAGSLELPGAAVLSSLAALRAGAGKVWLASTSSVIQITAAQAPDITYIDLGENNLGTLPKDAWKFIEDDYDAVSIGCGLGVDADTTNFLNNFLKNYLESQTPVIVDADAINILAVQKRPALPLNSIITPHPLELSRLTDIEVEEIQKDRVKATWEAAKHFDCIVLLKGQESVIAVPNGEIYVNTTGNSALAKAGTGDVLTGMIAGFCAQGVNLEKSAALSVYLHGLAGEIAAKSLTEYGVLASNLLNYVPQAIKETLAQPFTFEGTQP